MLQHKFHSWVIFTALLRYQWHEIKIAQFDECWYWYTPWKHHHGQDAGGAEPPWASLWPPLPTQPRPPSSASWHVFLHSPCVNASEALFAEQYSTLGTSHTFLIYMFFYFQFQFSFSASAPVSGVCLVVTEVGTSQTHSLFSHSAFTTEAATNVCLCLWTCFHFSHENKKCGQALAGAQFLERHPDSPRFRVLAPLRAHTRAEQWLYR